MEKTGFKEELKYAATVEQAGYVMGVFIVFKNIESQFSEGMIRS